MAWLLHVRRGSSTPGAVAARFVFWYAFPRFFIDLFREYPTHRLALGTGQTLNIVMAAIGAAALFRSRLRRLGRLKGSAGWGLAAAALATLRGYLDVDEVRRDAEIVFSCGPAGRLAMTVDGGERPPIESRVLCRALFDVYLGEDPIEQDGKSNTLAGFAGLLQPLVRR